MILSAGLTPAWQQILVFDRFRYGEVNRAAEVLAVRQNLPMGAFRAEEVPTAGSPSQ